MGVSKVREIVLDYSGVDSIIFDPAVPKILYFKHDVVAFMTITFIGNPNVDNIVLSYDNAIVVRCFTLDAEQRLTNFASGSLTSLAQKRPIIQKQICLSEDKQLLAKFSTG